MIYVIDFDPIWFQTQLALQNDCQHLNFLKDICSWQKMAGNSCKMAKHKSCQFFFRTDFNLQLCTSGDPAKIFHRVGIGQLSKILANKY